MIWSVVSLSAQHSVLPHPSAASRRRCLSAEAAGYVLTAYAIMAYVGMAYIVMAYIGMAYVGMTYIVMAYIGMTHLQNQPTAGRRCTRAAGVGRDVRTIWLWPTRVWPM